MQAAIVADPLICGECKPKYVPYNKLTTAMFVNKAQQVHGKEKYDYSKVKYKKSSVKVTIICNVSGHGPFEQVPSTHLSGYGCSKCSGLYRQTAAEFIEKAKFVHGIENIIIPKLSMLVIKQKLQLYVIHQNTESFNNFLKTI